MDSAFDIVKAIIAGKRRGMIRPLQALERTVIGISYGYSADEYARLWFFAMTPDELRDRAMRIYMTRRIVELKLIKRKKVNNENTPRSGQRVRRNIME